MRPDQLVSEVETTGVIGILRGTPSDLLIETVEAIVDGGVNVIEVTADNPAVVEQVRMLSDHFDDEVIFGVGTVLDAPTARNVLMAGASFIVTPTLNEAVIEMGNRYAAPVFPGAYTPTEVIRSFEAGAAAVKLFPAKSGGPDHLSAINGPLSQVPLIPTGGVSTQNATAYFEAGAFAVGVGSALADLDAARAGEFDSITETAATLTDIASQF
ncbi:MAG: Entner-Doudoroff aldolase [Haloquadratum sp. J07HQX50]|jgi:2-keto-3-deoxy-phosphogluconate aldolase (EC 4.1.2.14)|nr:MAG: Entner-Doudoroff aldolase [Haloquadratum sp. J07HQX50]